ncbi:MAG: hypothetical protein HYZ89_00690 [Candidatus Omnitrophica bacterium]|nr:hypothetical protein [Candidatus Omnitrophota bacterium]
MKKSKILQQDRDNLVLLSKRMTPEERLVAFFHHSRLIRQLYQAGLSYRSAVRPPSQRRAKTR